MLQHDVITTSCLFVLIEKLVLRVNTTKQHDVTTRRYDNDLFDYSSSTNQHYSIPSNTTHTASNPSIPLHYRCNFTTESRKVLSIKNPQHYFFIAADLFPIKINQLNKMRYKAKNI